MKFRENGSLIKGGMGDSGSSEVAIFEDGLGLPPHILDKIQEAQQIGAGVEFLQERIAELEFALEDRFYNRLSGDSATEFSPGAIKEIVKLSRIAYLKNPIITRGINVKKFYVWGQGVSIIADNKDVQKVILEFIKDYKNRVEITGHTAQMQKEVELQTDANIFLVLFTDPTGKVTVRSLSFFEINDIITNPQDKKEPWYYLREWTESTQINAKGGSSIKTRARKAYYPDWRYTPVVKPSNIKGIPVHWRSPVNHIAGPMRFSGDKYAVPEVYPALDWVRAYKNFLEDVATLMRAFSRYAWNLHLKKGGKAAIAQAKTKMSSTITKSNAVNTNPAPVAGATFIGGENATMVPFQLRGVNVDPEDGRRLLLMAAAALGLPETFFGDVSTGNLATAKSLDRPTELSMMDRRTFWTDHLRDLMEFVVLQSVKAGELTGVATLERTTRGGRIVERINWTDPKFAIINVDFPPIIDSDLKTQIDSIVSAATLEGNELAGTMTNVTLTRLLLSALGEDDIEIEIAKLYNEDGTVKDTEELTTEESALLGAVTKFNERVEEMKQLTSIAGS